MRPRPAILSGVRSGSDHWAELEYYGDRRVRPELELSVPRSVQSAILRKFRTALEICRSTLEGLKEQRPQLDVQELRQLQLIEGVVARYAPRRSPGLGRQSAPPDPLPRSLLGVFDSVRRQLDPPPRNRLLLAFDDGAIQPWFPSDTAVVGLVPLLIQQVSGTYLIAPALEHFSPQLSFLSDRSPNWRNAPLNNCGFTKRNWNLKHCCGEDPPSSEQLVQKLTQRAAELKQDADQESVALSAMCFQISLV